MAELEKVLIVDDDALIREMVGDAVKRAGFEPLLTASTHDAIGILAVLQPMAVLLDLYMPEDPGDECCKVIKGNSDLARVPVVFMTGGEADDDVKRAFFAGGDDFLPKPVREAQLVAKLKAIKAGGKAPAGVQPRGSSKKTVLVADDDGLFRQMVGHVLERAGHTPVYADNGLEALRLMLNGTQPPDLCVVDLVMPGIGGLELVRKLRETPAAAQVPVVAVTSTTKTPELLQSLAALGVNVVIAKNPSALEDLLPQVNAALFGGDNSRATPRVPLHRGCEFRRVDDADWCSGFISNISSTGVAVRTLTPPAENAPVELRFSLSSGGPKVVAKAAVEWSHPFLPADPGSYPYGMGLRFVELEASARQHIDALTRAR